MLLAVCAIGTANVNRYDFGTALDATSLVIRTRMSIAVL